MKKRTLAALAVLALLLTLATPLASAAGDFEIHDGVVEKYHGAGGIVVVPDGVRVIGDYAFSECGTITSVTLPEGLKDIGNYAFMNCTAMTEITIPDSADFICSNAFTRCDALKRFVMSGEGKYLVIDGVLFVVSASTTVNDVVTHRELQLVRFPQAKTSGGYTLPAEVTSIDNEAFSQNTMLTAVVLPEGVKCIGFRAFSGCTALTQVTLPASLTEIQDDAFSGCSALTGFAVAAGNPVYASSEEGMSAPGGALYTADMKTLLSYPVGNGGASFRLPNSVSTVAGYAAQGCEALEELTLGYGLQTVCEHAFDGCKNLRTVRFRAGLRKIESYAFQGCDAVTDLYYGGLEGDWSDVRREAYYGLTRGERHYGEDPVLATAEKLYPYGLFVGTGAAEDGSIQFELDRTPRSTEAITMLVRLLGKEEEAKAGSWTTPFTDVPKWAEPYVGYAYANGYTNGTGAAKFGSDDDVSATRYISFVLSALGYEKGMDFQWNKAWELSDALGITGGEYADGGTFTRGDLALISYNALDAELKDEGVTLRAYLTQEQESGGETGEGDSGGSGETGGETVTYACRICGGTGRTTCGGCGGMGRYSYMQTVPDPATGGFRTEMVWVTCGVCHGTGTATCTHCGGTGHEP